MPKEGEWAPVNDPGALTVRAGRVTLASFAPTSTHGLYVAGARVLADNTFRGEAGLEALCEIVRRAWAEGTVVVLAGWTVFTPEEEATDGHTLAVD